MVDPDLSSGRRHVLRSFATLTGIAASGITFAAQQGSTPEHLPAGIAPVDPRVYGAQCDGVTDDSEALRAAMRAHRAIMFLGPMLINQVVDLPYEVALLGHGVHRSRIVLGPRGKLRIVGESFERRGGGTIFRDLTVSPIDKANQDYALEVRHMDRVLFDNVTFYLVSLLFDEHHYMVFRQCMFFGEPGRSVLLSNCVSQRQGAAAISECPLFTGCFFTSFPILLEDTVAPRFTDCVFFSGPYSIRSVRRLARGSELEPFFMGPVINGCVFDSVNGPALDIEGGGTDCRMINNLFAAGRPTNAPGVVLTGSSAVELIGNRFEWCGAAGLVLDGCEKIGVIGNSFANIAGGPGIRARGSRDIRVIGNAFENRRRWGGSAEGFTTLAIDAADAGCADWVVTGNTASGLRDPRVSTLRSSLIYGNIGWPPATEQGWPAGASNTRPREVGDGYRWYDQSLGQWIHWHAGSRCWRDPSGHPV